jgi:Fe-S-cluster containining protein
MCDKCGKCCSLHVEIVSGIDDVPEEMTEIRGDHLGRDSTWMKQIEGVCVAYKNGCTIYDRRPLECRQFIAGKDTRCHLTTAST